MKHVIFVILVYHTQASFGFISCNAQIR